MKLIEAVVKDEKQARRIYGLVLVVTLRLAVVVLAVFMGHHFFG